MNIYNYRGDCSTLTTEAELPLDIKGRVAIIDLRVFVPEVYVHFQTVFF